MIRFAAVRRLLTAVALALAVAAIWLALDNPEIHGTSRGDDYACLAPYDTVLNGPMTFPEATRRQTEPTSRACAARPVNTGSVWL